jgi:hypothetical protein
MIQARFYDNNTGKAQGHHKTPGVSAALVTADGLHQERVSRGQRVTALA